MRLSYKNNQEENLKNIFFLFFYPLRLGGSLLTSVSMHQPEGLSPPPLFSVRKSGKRWRKHGTFPIFYDLRGNCVNSATCQSIQGCLAYPALESSVTNFYRSSNYRLLKIKQQIPRLLNLKHFNWIHPWLSPVPAQVRPKCGWWLDIDSHVTQFNLVRTGTELCKQSKTFPCLDFRSMIFPPCPEFPVKL